MRISLIIIGMFLMSLIFAQEKEDEKSGYEFTVTKEIPTTPVKNQYKSGTCWSFSGLAMLESELLRMGKGEYDLSEMFVVRQTYVEKAKQYVRFHGNVNFGGGGAFHDVLMVMDKYGMVPEEAYSGKVIGEDKHIHGELDAVVMGYLKAVIKNKNKKLTPVWLEGFKGILDAYLGEYPESFTYQGKEYTPQSFAASLGINTGDYVEIASFTHHSFYQKFIIELPDNWALDFVWNVPLDEMMNTIDHALENGYSVAWGSDVSEKGFSWKNGIAIIPEENLEDMDDTERAKWDELSEKERQKQLYSFDEPGKEKEITQQLRQKSFDNYTSTDDHGMLISGMAEDQAGSKYYLVKNSWGTDGVYDGYFYASVPFVAYKTIDIMLHRDAIPKNISEKLNFN